MTATNEPIPLHAKPPIKRTWAFTDARHVKALLAHFQGNATKAAALAGCGASTLLEASRKDRATKRISDSCQLALAEIRDAEARALFPEPAQPSLELEEELAPPEAVAPAPPSVFVVEVPRPEADAFAGTLGILGFRFTRTR